MDPLDLKECLKDAQSLSDKDKAIAIVALKQHAHVLEGKLAEAKERIAQQRSTLVCYDCDKLTDQVYSLKKALRYLSGGTSDEWGWMSGRRPCFCHDVHGRHTPHQGDHSDRCKAARDMVGDVVDNEGGDL